MPADAAEALESDRDAFARFFGAMLDAGVLLPPSPFEAWFPGSPTATAEIDATSLAAADARRVAA